MKKGQAFPSTYLGKDDVTAPMVVTIAHVTTEPVSNDGGKEDKRVAHFREQNMKPFIINAGNWDAIAEISGQDDDDEWGGTRIEIYVDPSVMYGGKRVGGVRVRRPAAAPQAPTTDAKRVAWAAWKSRNPDIADDADALASRLQAVVNDIYPGITLGKLTPKQWSELERSGFNHPVTPAGTGINEADIPF